jgi:hypothetical protein
LVLKKEREKRTDLECHASSGILLMTLFYFFFF